MNNNQQLLLKLELSKVELECKLSESLINANAMPGRGIWVKNISFNRNGKNVTVGIDQYGYRVPAKFNQEKEDQENKKRQEIKEISKFWKNNSNILASDNDFSDTIVNYLKTANEKDLEKLESTIKKTINYLETLKKEDPKLVDKISEAMDITEEELYEKYGNENHFIVEAVKLAKIKTRAFRKEKKSIKNKLVDTFLLIEASKKIIKDPKTLNDKKNKTILGQALKTGATLLGGMLLATLPEMLLFGLGISGISLGLIFAGGLAVTALDKILDFGTKEIKKIIRRNDLTLDDNIKTKAVDIVSFATSMIISPLAANILGPKLYTTALGKVYQTGTNYKSNIKLGKVNPRRVKEILGNVDQSNKQLFSLLLQNKLKGNQWLQHRNPNIDTLYRRLAEKGISPDDVYQRVNEIEKSSVVALQNEVSYLSKKYEVNPPDVDYISLFNKGSKSQIKYNKKMENFYNEVRRKYLDQISKELPFMEENTINLFTEKQKLFDKSYDFLENIKNKISPQKYKELKSILDRRRKRINSITDELIADRNPRINKYYHIDVHASKIRDKFSQLIQDHKIKEDIDKLERYNVPHPVRSLVREFSKNVRKLNKMQQDQLKFSYDYTKNSQGDIIYSNNAYVKNSSLDKSLIVHSNDDFFKYLLNLAIPDTKKEIKDLSEALIKTELKYGKTIDEYIRSNPKDTKSAFKKITSKIQEDKQGFLRFKNEIKDPEFKKEVNETIQKVTKYINGKSKIDYIVRQREELGLQSDYSLTYGRINAYLLDRLLPKEVVSRFKGKDVQYEVKKFLSRDLKQLRLDTGIIGVAPGQTPFSEIADLTPKDVFFHELGHIIESEKKLYPFSYNFIDQRGLRDFATRNYAGTKHWLGGTTELFPVGLERISNPEGLKDIATRDRTHLLYTLFGLDY